VLGVGGREPMGQRLKLVNLRQRHPGLVDRQRLPRFRLVLRGAVFI
jgi:hypothetical protein